MTRLSRATLERALQLASLATPGPYRTDNGDIVQRPSYFDPVTGDEKSQPEYWADFDCSYSLTRGTVRFLRNDAANIAHNADPEFVKSVVTALIECRAVLETIVEVPIVEDRIPRTVKLIREIFAKHFEPESGEE